MLVSFTLIFIGLIGRWVTFNLYGEKSFNKGSGQWTWNLAVYPKGNDQDRNGNILAQSGAETIAARPSQIKDPKGIMLLAPILEMDEDSYTRNYRIQKALVWIKRQVTREVANQVRR